MTEQKAIEVIKRVYNVSCPAHEDEMLYEKAIELAIKALGKQIPKKPKEYEDKYYACSCGNVLLMKWEKYNTILTQKSKGLPYCLACGQKLDWDEEE